MSNPEIQLLWTIQQKKIPNIKTTQPNSQILTRPPQSKKPIKIKKKIKKTKQLKQMQAFAGIDFVPQKKVHRQSASF